jgi:hypothetical protein
MYAKLARKKITINSFWQNLLFLTQRLIRFKFIYPIMLDWRMITKIDSYIYLRTKNRKSIVNSSYKLLLQAYPDMPHEINTKFLFIKSLIRPDYDEFFNNVFSQIDDPGEKINITYKYSNIVYYVRLLKLIFYFPIFIRIYHKNIKVSLYCYVRAITYIGVLKVIDKYSFKYLVSFADMQGVENLIIQYFNKRNVCTATMQHGLYVDYTQFDNINRVNYENTVSKYFLAWGNETTELIKRYHPSTKIVICGKPLAKVKYNSLSDFFTVVFDQSLFTEQNRELLAIAYSISEITKLNINVRMHPWDLKERYVFKAGSTSLSGDIFQSNFVIGHTTSMIFECMRNGIPAFKYKTKYPSNVVSNDLTFTNTEELIQRIQHIGKYNFTELGKYYLEYVGDDSLQQYARFFNSLKKQ